MMEKIYCVKPFFGNFKLSSAFGERADPLNGVKKMHNGIDFACPIGTPIRSVLDGKIFVSGWEVSPEFDPKEYMKKGYGKRIWMECDYHGEKLLIVYAHLSEIHRNKGEFVCQTGIIGLSGNTGRSTGPHLHIGARIKDTNTFLDFEFEDMNLEVMGKTERNHEQTV